MRYAVRTALVAALFAFGLQAIAADPPGTHPTAPAQPGARPMVTADNTMGHAGGHFLASKKIAGANVKNARGDKLGTIEDFVVSTNDGKVTYAAIGVGGALGIGTKYHAVPFSELKPQSTGKDEFEF